MNDVKRAGCCTRCDTEVFEVKTRFLEGPLAGFPRQLGKHSEQAYRIDYALTDGSICTLTACEACREWMSDPANLPAIWQKVLRTFVFEERADVRAALPARPRTPAEQQHIQTELIKLSHNPPIGVIAVNQWSHHA